MRSPILLSLLVLLLIPCSGLAQIITTDPQFPLVNKALTIIYDASQGSAGLKDYTGDVYAHTGVLTQNSTGTWDWKYVKTEWGENTPETRLNRISANLYSLEITPSIREYYGTPDGEEITHMAFVFRNSDGSKQGKDVDGGDLFVEVSPGNLGVWITKPDRNLLIEPGISIDFEALASEPSELILFQNGSELKSIYGDSISHTFSFSSPGDFWLKVTSNSGGETVADSVFVHAMEDQASEPAPENLKDGINYIDEHTVQLLFHAPYKSHVFIIGDFNNWTASSAYRMVKDGDRWWITLNDLTPAREYGFQYLVDGELFIADPYTEKTLDPKDKRIDEATYPGLKAYPEGLTTGITAVLQTARDAYEWKNTAFDAPSGEDLIIYELLLRDFVAAHDWKTLSDTLNYISELGVNAIELMPVNEFEDNESWGYNTSFYFAPDKYYGPARDLKVFIDSCHGRGIAVILDMVLNHSFSQSPLVQLYFENGKVTDENPWYNVDSPNPVYFWGYDFNHESMHTRDFVDRVTAHWLTEYRVDGYRFDFTKGFTNKPGDGWAYDASRIAILKRMASAIWNVNPAAHVILEHLADNEEEKVLSDFGMMLWGNMNESYNEATMGYNENNKSNFSGISYKTRGWSDPHLVGYMESHDEERLMYKNLEYGNASGDYKVQELNTALERMELAGAFFFTVPGPKMITQFGELGYDYSINDPCRVCNKPIRWDYNSGSRNTLYQAWASLIELRKSETAFHSEDFTLSVAGPGKRIEINHPDMDVRIIGNFDVNLRLISANFSRSGWWYEYFSGDSLQVENLYELQALDPGAYRIYTTRRLTPPGMPVSLSGTDPFKYSLMVYPNPFRDLVFVEARESESRISVVNLAGLEMMSVFLGSQEREIDLSSLPEGMYILNRYVADREPEHVKILKISR